MKSKHVLPIKSPSFALLVRRLKKEASKAEVLELHLDNMRVKGDLAVINNHFNRPFIAKSMSQDLLRRGIKAGFAYADADLSIPITLEFKNLLKNKGAKLIRSYHNYEETPQNLEEILQELAKEGDLLKIATQVNSPEDNQSLLALLDLPNYKNKLIITGMGPLGRETRIKAPLQGSIFYYAPLTEKAATAPGQLTKTELEQEWESL